jgi:hypothetical protein
VWEPILETLNALARPAITEAVTRGAMRACLDLGYAPLLEVSLANGRRADLCGINAKGHIIIIEVKSCVADFAVDFKWTDYEEFCDLFYFAAPPNFPVDLLAHPSETGAPGIILADQFGGAIFRPAPIAPLAPARRKAMTLHLARLGAERVALRTLDSAL